MAHSSQATLAAAAMAFAQTLRPGKVLRFVHQTLGQGQTRDKLRTETNDDGGRRTAVF